MRILLTILLLSACTAFAQTGTNFNYPRAIPEGTSVDSLVYATRWWVAAQGYLTAAPSWIQDSLDRHTDTLQSHNLRINAKQNTLTNPVTGAGISGYLPHFTGTSTIDSSALWYDAANKRLGIGTTAPEQQFHLKGATSAVAQLEGTLDNSAVFYLKSNGVIKSAWGYSKVIRGLVFEHNEGGASLSSPTLNIVSQKVGIGTMNPLTTLHVVGTSALMGNVGIGRTNPTATLEVNSKSASAAQFRTYNSMLGEAAPSDSLGLTTLADGKTGIGTTAPNSKLEVKSLGKVIGSAMNVTDSAGTSLLYVKSDGKVGIGTTAPGKPLDVIGEIRGNSNILASSGLAGLNYLGVYNTSNNLFAISCTNAGSSTGVTMNINSSEKFRLTNAGLVGIGTTNPLAKLHVAGTIQTGVVAKVTADSVNALRLYGNATVFEDLRIDGLTSRGGPREPVMTDNFAGVSGMYQRFWQGSAQDDEMFFNIQMPHQWKEGGKFELHIHNCPWTTPGVADSVVWEITYEWENINGTYGTFVTDTVVQRLNGTAQWQHKLVEVINLNTPASGKTISSILACRLRRLANGSANDTYTGGMTVLYIDGHYEIDALGSQDELTK